jgi:hypothetical protein
MFCISLFLCFVFLNDILQGAGVYSAFSWARLLVLRPRGSLLVQTIYIVSGDLLMLVTLSTCSRSVVRHECYIHSRSRLAGSPWLPRPERSHRVGRSLSGLDVQIPFYGMQSFAYSPAPGSGGSLRSLIYPGPRRLHRPVRSGYSVFRKPEKPGFRTPFRGGVFTPPEMGCFTPSRNTPIWGGPKTPVWGPYRVSKQ